MTKFLLNLAVGKGADLESSTARSGVGKLSGMVGICCNAVLFGGKLAVGMLSGSVSIMADAMNNLTDAASAVVTLLGFKLAEKPADSEHPYGHARYEYLTALAVAALILVIGFELAKVSVEKIITPAVVVMSVPMALVLVGSIALKLWLSRFNARLGKLIDSGALTAAAADSRNDCIATGATLIAAALQAIFSWRVDGIMGLGVALFILYSGISLAKDTISPLLGEAASPELRRLILKEMEDPRILGYHDLMVHDYGPGQRFASLHVEMDKDEDPLMCHEIIDDLERQCLKDHGVHLVIHYDPVVTDDPELERMRMVVASMLRMKDAAISIHDFRMVPGTGHTNLIFDVSLPIQLHGQEETIQTALEAALNDLGEGRYHTVITFDPAGFNQ